MKKPKKPRKNLPKVTPVIAAEPLVVGQLVTITPGQEPIPESICDRARRLASTKHEKDKAERDAKKQAFLDSMFMPHDYVRNEDGTYTICGWRWRVLEGSSADMWYLSFNTPWPCADVPDTYRGIVLRYQTAYDLTQFGQALLAIDQQVAAIDAQYPDTFWGRVRLWLATH